MSSKAAERARKWAIEYFKCADVEGNVTDALAAYEAATIERCAQIAEQQITGTLTSWSADELRRAAAAIRSMGDGE